MVDDTSLSVETAEELGRVRAELTRSLSFQERVESVVQGADSISVVPSREIIEIFASDPRIEGTRIKEYVVHILEAMRKTQAPITSENLMNALEIVFDKKNRNPRPISSKIVLDVICNHFGAELADISGRERTKDQLLHRRISMYLLREESKLPSTAIGNLLGGKDHSTVLYAQKRFEAQLKADPVLKREVEEVQRAIKISAGIF